MIKVDLITGFLGAGKTTFLLRYARYLMAQGMKIGILVYDHGAVNVDMPLLKELRGDQCELEMLAGGCDPECHKRRFRTKLIAMGMSGYDRVIIEPSGVFDMDEFFDTLNESPIDRWYEAGSVIAIVDAKLRAPMTEEEEFFLASQAASAGCVLLSRVQLATEEEIGAAIAHLNRAMEHIHGTPVPENRILCRDWEKLSDEDFRRLMDCGSYPTDYMKTIAGVRSEFQSLSFLELPLGRKELERRIRLLYTQPKYGRILRVKGFFPENGRWYQLNATIDETNVEEVPENRSAITVIGADLNENEISILLTGKTPEHRIL